MEINKRVKEIIRAWTFGDPPQEDLAYLKKVLDSHSENEVKELVQTIWEDEETPMQMPKKAKDRIFKQIIHQARESKRVFWTGWRVACAVLLPLMISWGLFWMTASSESPRQLVVESSKSKSRVLLPDGSSVWLNARSTLTYPTDFGRNERRVSIVGEGYFEVQKDAKRFYVQVNGLSVVVKGTKFNVRNMEGDETIQVSLSEGSVALEDHSQRSLAVLKPGQNIKVNRKSHQFSIEQEDPSLYALWTHKKCQFEEETPDEVFAKLEYWYGVNFKIENSKPDYKYGFTIKEESLQELLELINHLTPMEYEIKGKEVTIRYK